MLLGVDEIRKCLTIERVYVTALQHMFATCMVVGLRSGVNDIISDLRLHYVRVQAIRRLEDFVTPRVVPKLMAAINLFSQESIRYRTNQCSTSSYRPHDDKGSSFMSRGSVRV